MLLRLEMTVAALLLALGIILVPYSNIRLPSGGAVGGPFLMALGVAIAVGALVFSMRNHSCRIDVSSISQHWPRGHLLVIASGLLLQVLIAIFLHPVPVSDLKTYLTFAESLARFQSYVDSRGFHAFWPPGLPLYLSPFVWLFGNKLLAVVCANIVLFLLSVWAIGVIATRIFDRNVALLSIALFSFWPNRILMGGLASKENLTLCLVLLNLALLVLALDKLRLKRSALALIILSGLVLGLAVVTQPGLMLLLVLYPWMYRTWLVDLGLQRSLPLFFAILAGLAIAVSPWMIRNCHVFDGKFCGIATNGGSVFYRANNELATGTFIPEGKVPLGQMSELEQNNTGFKLGMQWIRGNPLAMVKLSFHKFRFFIAEDDYGPYWAIFRGLGLSEQDSRNGLEQSRAAVFDTALVIATIYWLMILSLAMVFLVNRLINFKEERVSPLIYPLLYGAAIFAVFESGARQHIAFSGTLIILAAAGLMVSLGKSAKL